MNLGTKLIFVGILIGITKNEIWAKSLEKNENDNGDDSSAQIRDNDELETTTELIVAFADNELKMNMNDTEPAKCAERHQVCRTHKPLPLPCCGDFVCKVTYGEQHCVEHDFNAS